MAIVQISRITHRKGLIENLPQLAGGEFGWAVDERRLFIGDGTLAEGAPVQLSYHDNPRRKLKWSLERIDMGSGWIGVNTGKVNSVIA